MTLAASLAIQQDRIRRSLYHVRASRPVPDKVVAMPKRTYSTVAREKKTPAAPAENVLRGIRPQSWEEVMALCAERRERNKRQGQLFNQRKREQGAA